MQASIIILSSLAAAILSAWLTRLFCRPTARFQVLDHPNERSLHSRPTPRTGGLAILTAVAVFAFPVVIYFGETGREAAWLGGGVLLVAGVSFLDDRYALSPALRIVLHVIAAVILAYGGFMLGPPGLPGIALAVPVPVMIGVSLIYIVWMTNLYNFMDGMDGFAGGMAIFGIGAFAVLGWGAGHWPFMSLNLIVASAAAGFILFNFPPARIFMGDVGSSTLGLLAAAFSLWGANDGVFSFWVTLLVFSPFIVDATVTLLRRLLRREKIWQAHKTHFYQQLVQAGWGHRKTVLWEYVLMAACAGSAIWVARQTETVQWWTIGFWTMVYVLLIAMVRRLEAGNLRTRKEDRRA